MKNLTAPQQPDKSARLALEFVPGSYSAEDGTIDIRFYSGLEVPRYGYLDGEYQKYYLKFDMDAIDSTRIGTNGVGLFLDATYGGHAPNVRGQVGITVPGTLKKGEGGWQVKFKLEDVSGYPPEHDIARAVRKLQTGELNNFSMGVIWGREERAVVDGVMHVTAFDWQPYEITAVAYDADPNTTALNMEEGAMPGTNGEVASLEGQQVPGETGSAPETAAELTGLKGADAAELSAAGTAATKAERARVQELTMLCKKFECEDRLSAMIADGTSVVDAKDQVLALIDARRKADPRPAGALAGSTTGIQPGADEADKQAEAMEEALAFRMAPRLFDRPNGNPYLGKSLIAMAGARLNLQAGRHVYDPEEIVRQTMFGRDALAGGTPSDFPLIATGGLRRYMLKSTINSTQKFQQIANQRDMVDFREETGVRIEYSEDLDMELKPGQKYPEAKMSETGETRKVIKKGSYIYLTEELLRNNDMNGFADQANKILALYRRKESQTFWKKWAEGAGASGAGQKMRDDKRAFCNDHKNLLAGEALSGTAIEKMLVKLAAQKDGGIEQDWDGYAIIVPGALKFTAERVILSEYQPTTPEGARLRAVQSLKIISDAVIDSYTTKGFWVVADPALVDTAVYGWLAGQTGPELFPPEWVSDRDAWGWKVRDIFTAAIMDYRGAVFCPGA